VANHRRREAFRQMKHKYLDISVHPSTSLHLHSPVFFFPFVRSPERRPISHSCVVFATMTLAVFGRILSQLMALTLALLAHTSAQSVVRCHVFSSLGEKKKKTHFCYNFLRVSGGGAN
jgi:hypothetical protein